MMNLPPNTVKVAPENKCDVCREKDAPYYNLTYYIHICSCECFKMFCEGYNREIDEIARKKLAPDEVETLKKGRDK